MKISEKKLSLLFKVLVVLNLLFASVFVWFKVWPRHSVNVALIDTGIDTEGHPRIKRDLVWEYDIKSGKNKAPDTHGHGTFMAGIICRANDYLYFDLNLYMVRIAIRIAIRGPDGNVGTDDDADIISMSIGGPPSSISYEAIKFASSRDVIMIAPAGNRGDGNTSTNEIDYPAKNEEVVCVGAYDEENKRVPKFSGEGKEIDVVAPGINIISAGLDGKLLRANGTSVAVPFIAGVSSIFLARSGNLPTGNFNTTDPTTLRGKLYQVAEDVGKQGWDKSSGQGAVLKPINRYIRIEWYESLLFYLIILFFIDLVLAFTVVNRREN